jgi:hypothetical protein
MPHESLLPVIHINTQSVLDYELVLFSKYNQNDQVKEGEMGRAYSTNGGEEECI